MEVLPTVQSRFARRLAKDKAARGFARHEGSVERGQRKCRENLESSERENCAAQTESGILSSDVMTFMAYFG